MKAFEGRLRSEWRSRFRNGNAFIRQGRAADDLQVLQAHGEPLPGLIEIRYLIERAQFARLGPLAVVHVKKCGTIFLIRDRGSDAAVHAAAHEDNSEVIFHVSSLPALRPKFYRFVQPVGDEERRGTKDERRKKKAREKSSLILASDASGRPSSFVSSVRPVNEHGQAPGTDDLLFAFMVTGEIDPVLVRGVANETFDLHLTLRGVDFVDDLVRVEIMHHGPEGY